MHKFKIFFNFHPILTNVFFLFSLARGGQYPPDRSRGGIVPVSPPLAAPGQVDTSKPLWLSLSVCHVSPLLLRLVA